MKKILKIIIWILLILLIPFLLKLWSDFGKDVKAFKDTSHVQEKKQGE